MKLPYPKSRAHRQGGYMLLAILLMLALLIMAAAAAAPTLAQQIKRQREEELIHRGLQYARAIKRFYRKTGRYPTRLEELDNTNNLRFLRKHYKDPITGKDEWKLVHFGEATNPQAQPGAAGGLAGAAPGGQAGTTAPGTGGIGIQSPAGGTVGTPVSQVSSPAGSGPTFGGGPIIGVASTSEAESLKEINGNDHYNQWLFVYDARYDTGAQQALPGQGTGTPGGPTRPGLPGMGTGAGPGPQPPAPPQTPRPPQ